MREFPCKLLRVVNGNTVEGDFDRCFGVFMPMNIRLLGVSDTNEAMTALIKILPKEFICTTSYNKRGKAGRCLGHIFVEQDGEMISINDILIHQGFGLPDK